MRRMMMFSAIAALMALVSCQQEEIVPAEETSQEETPVVAGKTVFTASTEKAATRTSLSESYEVLWSEGDEITVVDAASTPNVGVYSAISISNTQADFTLGSGAEAATAPYRAYYPAALYNSGTPTLPATQTYVAGNITGAPMYAESGNNNLKFKNLGGIIKLNVTTSDSNRKVRSITLSADQALSGPFTITNDAAVVSGSAGVTLDCGSEGVAIGSTATAFHIAVPAANYTNLKISVLTIDGGKQSRTATSTIVVGRSSITEITLGFNSLEMDAIDLSESATANTYIVSAAGTYKFKATVKGNGGLDPVTGTTASTIAPSSIAGVKVLWELQERGRTIKYSDGAYEVYYADGYVFFNTPDSFVPGDAYLAVYDESGTILWSWLIWATAKPSEVEYNGSMFLDRNIGSLVGTGYEGGFSYQWGRPAPFSSAYNKSYTPFTYSESRSSIFTFEDIGSGKDAAYGISHPTTYYIPVSKYNWMSPDAFITTLWADNVKTIYDPSPIGWKVPSKDQLTGITGTLSFYGTGFIGTSTSDFGYGNPGSVLLWSSTCDENGAWSNAYGSMYQKYSSWPDCNMTSGMPIRPVEDAASLSYVDLSAEETANSYIVPGPGNYKFKATVKGNGAADLAGISKTTSASDIASVDLVWASYGTSTAPASSEMLRGISYQDGYVYFRVPDSFREGNAIVAIKDAGGTVLWSWHLWFTGADIEGSVQTYPSGAVMMDRNLGALSAAYNSSNTLDWGLMYQWGRKDPFLNSKSLQFTSGYVSSSNASTVFRPAVLGTAENYVTAYQANSTVAAVNKFPQYLFTSWYVSSNSNGQMEWASDVTDNLWAEDKTIFDPCPAGWKVPSKSAWEGAFVTDLDAAELTDNGFTVSGIRYPNTAVRLAQAVYIDGIKYCNGGLILENLQDYHIFVWAYDGQLHKEKFSYEYAQGSNHPITTGVYSNPPIGGSSQQSSAYFSTIPSHARSYFYRTRAGAVRCVRE